METKKLQCDCGIQVGLSWHAERHWCSECLWSEIQRLQAIVEARDWRDASTINPADGDEFLVAVRGSDNETVWWDFEIVTVQSDELHCYLEVNGDPWDCDWEDVAWCIPMSAMQPPEAAEKAKDAPSSNN